MKNVASLLPRVVGPMEQYCASCGMQPDGAYVTTPVIGVGVAPLACSHSGSHLLDQIIAFDRAEGSSANITQTNLIAVSSFNGLQGLLLGYDLLPQPRQFHPLLDGVSNVYALEPLLAATQALYGTLSEKRFPIAPGQHILSAYKALYKQGPCRLYGALAVGIAEDRTYNADLFMEDHGTLMETEDTEAEEANEATVLKSLLDAVHQIGDNLSVRYSTVFLGVRSRFIQAGEVGCVLTAAPYIHLARNAVPNHQPQCLQELTLSEWEEATRPHFLSR